MGREYSESERIQVIADSMIADHYPHLKTARIAYVMKERNPEAEQKDPKDPREGKTRSIAKATLVPPVYCLLSGYDFVLKVDEVLWDLLDLKQQEALVDHELCHCVRDEKGWYVRDHDVTEFREILERHGFWHPKLEEFVSAAPVQKELPFSKAAVNQ